MNILDYLKNEIGAVGSFSAFPRQFRKKQLSIREMRADRQKPKEIDPIAAGTTASQETQRRADIDRNRALAMERQRYQESLAAYQTQQQESLAALDPWKQQIETMQAAPEAIGQREAGQIYEAARIPIEAQTQGLLRQMQEQFTPGGYRQKRMLGAQESKIGQLAGVRQEVETTRALRRREDQLAIMRQMQGYGQAAGGIRGRTATGVAGLGMTSARLRSQLLGRTITAVPTYSTTPTKHTQPWTYQG